MREEYDKVIAQIDALQKRKAELEKLMFETSESFVEKFRIWYNNDDGGFYPYIINFPKLRALFDRIDEPRRGQTYALEDLVGYDYDFWRFIDKEMTDEEENDYLILYQEALQEAMDNNMKAFKADW